MNFRGGRRYMETRMRLIGAIGYTKLDMRRRLRMWWRCWLKKARFEALLCVMQDVALVLSIPFTCHGCWSSETVAGKGRTAGKDAELCLDVLIHYPQIKADAMVAHLASLAEYLHFSQLCAQDIFCWTYLRDFPFKGNMGISSCGAGTAKGWLENKKEGPRYQQFYFSRIVEAVPA